MSPCRSKASSVLFTQRTLPRLLPEESRSASAIFGLSLISFIFLPLASVSVSRGPGLALPTRGFRRPGPSEKNYPPLDMSCQAETRRVLWGHDNHRQDAHQDR